MCEEKLIIGHRYSCRGIAVGSQGRYLQVRGDLRNP